MPLQKIVVWGCFCFRCGHRWVPRPKEGEAKAEGRRRLPLDPLDPGPMPEPMAVEPTICPNCKSPYWWRPPRADGAEVRREAASQEDAPAAELKTSPRQAKRKPSPGSKRPSVKRKTKK